MAKSYLLIYQRPPCTFKYRLKLKDGGVLDKDRARSRITVVKPPQIQITRAYTTDESGLEHVLFNPGDRIFYRIRYYVDATSAYTVKVIVRLAQFGERIVETRTQQQAGGGQITIEGTVPFNATPGQTRVVYRVVLKRPGVGKLETGRTTSQITILQTGIE